MGFSLGGYWPVSHRKPCSKFRFPLCVQSNQGASLKIYFWEAHKSLSLINLKSSQEKKKKKQVLVETSPLRDKTGSARHIMHCASYQNTPHGETNGSMNLKWSKVSVASGDSFETGPVATQAHCHQASRAKPALLQPPLIHTPGDGCGRRGCSPGNLNRAKRGTDCS